MYDDARQFVQQFEDQVRPLETGVAEAWWKLNTTGDERWQQEVARLGAAHKKAFANADNLARIESWLASDELTDPALRRQLELLRLAHLEHQLDETHIEEVTRREAELELVYNTFRGVVRGERVSDNRIDNVLRTSQDQDLRREFWEASKRVGAEVAERVVELALLRNQAARKLGYRDYFQMQLALMELPEERLFQILDPLAADTDLPFAEAKAEIDQYLADRYQIDVKELQPWHYQDRFFQEPPELSGRSLDEHYRDRDLQALTDRFYRGIGFDVSDIEQRSDLYEREGKCQHAFCIHLDGEGDVRVLVNLRPNEYWMSTNLHEFGHAVYDKYLGDLPWVLKGPAHTMSTEAVAIFMERFAGDPEWLEKILGLETAVVDRLRPVLDSSFKTGRLVFTRWAMVMVNFERAFYADPTRDDLNQLWWDLVEKFQGIRRPADRDEPDWAAKIHVATAPVYYQNYILGNLMAAQLRAHMAGTLTDGQLVDNPEVGQYLRERLFASGRLYDWDETIEQVTGERLNPAHFVAEVR